MGGAYVIREKLKLMKKKLKKWHEQNFRYLKNVEIEAVNKIKELNAKDDLEVMSLSEGQLREEEIMKF